MNEEQLIATLQACYFGDKGAFNKMLKEYKQIQHNWNELKRILKEMYIHTQYTGYLDIIYKMQELEEGGNNENN